MNYKPEIYAFKFITGSLAALLMPSSAQALALADIELHSTLNQPLHTTIPVSGTSAELSLLNRKKTVN